MDELRAGLQRHFGHDAFRPHQEAVCADVVAGHDVLLVMPTGAGKSLCYQLPGLLRDGTTLVISPLIALMEDQVAKLVAQGLRAERIHSGRDRESSRTACRRYLAGDLDFLFIAPERLGVPGFPELLQKGKLALLAVDEAHCISMWGHDFRPDYRLVGERLMGLRPTPVIAMTATATSRVQEDIAEQLGLQNPRRHIHGFRRTNIAIEVVQAAYGERAAIASRVLQGENRLPAIVYASTRKQAEEAAKALSAVAPAAAYHAGLETSVRQRVQDAFIAGDIKIVVATIAFGMGIDKADIRTVLHLSLSGAVENYYQEIGRAGRDGQAARAVLLFSPDDARTHEFLLRKNYPELKTLRVVYGRVAAEGTPRLAACDEASEEDMAALDKLRALGAVRIDARDTVLRTDSKGWEKTYQRQRDHRAFQIEEMERYAVSRDVCRMVALIRHFGDTDDSGGPCGKCDVCRPGETLIHTSRGQNAREREGMKVILAVLQAESGMALSRLHREVADITRLSKEDCGVLVEALVSAGLVRATRESFERGGHAISYRSLTVTEKGRKIKESDLADITIAAFRTPARAPRSRAPSFINRMRDRRKG